MSNYKFPSIKLFLDGKEVKAPLRNYLASLEVSESLEQIDMMEARFTIPPTSKARTDVLKLGKHGAKMKVQMCAGGQTKRTIEGMVIEVGYSGAGAKAIELTLRGLSNLTKVKGSSLAIVHKGNDAAVVKKIATAAGLGADVQGVSGAAEFQFQPNITNAEAVQQIAKRNNYVFRVDEGKLVFSRVTKAGKGVKLKIPWSAVSDFNLNASLDGIVTDVTVTGKDLKANKWLKGQAKAADIAKISGGKSGVDLTKKAFGKVEYLIDHTDDADQSQLVAVAKGELQRRAERFVQGEFTCRFEAEARSGAQVTIVDPAHFAMKGPFIVKEVTHLWDTAQGYRSRISFISDSLPAE
jgi:phage protein D